MACSDAGWRPETLSALKSLIRKGAGKHLPVVFDFDNTIICGDVGEATLAVLARSGLLAPKKLSKSLSPRFRLPGRGEVKPEGLKDVTEYYEAFLEPAVHGPNDPAPLANGYAWIVEIMEGLRPLDILNATREAFEWPSPVGNDPQRGPGSKTEWIEVTPGKTGYPVPFFYPQMVELIAELLDKKFEVWIVSASNVWSVRWMVVHGLNPLLRQRGLKSGLAPERVVGISTLLTDRKGYLYKDRVLVKENPQYARLDEKLLGKFRLTSRLHFPVPTYSGKIACIYDALGRSPYLVAGDSPGDLPMMAFGQHRLWISRLEKPGYQQAACAQMKSSGGSWLVQPTLTKRVPGFLRSPDEVTERFGKVPSAIRRSMRLMSGR